MEKLRIDREEEFFKKYGKKLTDIIRPFEILKDSFGRKIKTTYIKDDVLLLKLHQEIGTN